MIAFMEYEATEMTEEIDSNAEGVFCYEKGRLIQEARQKMQRTYERREKMVVKQALMYVKFIVTSNLIRKYLLSLRGKSTIEYTVFPLVKYVRVAKQFTADKT